MTDAPDPDEMMQMLNTINITLCRLYDTQMVLLAETNPDAAADLEALHENGRFLGSPPSISDDPFDWEEDVES